MSLVYPLDLSALTRQIEQAEKVSIESQYDTQSIHAALTLLSTSISHIQAVYNGGIEDRKEEFNAIVQKTQEIGNDLYGRIEALGLASGDLDTVTQNLSSLRALVEGDGALTVIKSIDATADEVNSREATISYPVTISDATGKATLDISALGINSTADFRLGMSPDATSNFVFTHYAAKKIDSSTVEVIAYDAKWTPEQEKLYDGSVNPAKFVVTVHYFRPKIDIDLTDTTGATQEVGGE